MLSGCLRIASPIAFNVAEVPFCKVLKKNSRTNHSISFIKLIQQFTRTVFAITLLALAVIIKS